MDWGKGLPGVHHKKPQEYLVTYGSPAFRESKTQSYRERIALHHGPGANDVEPILSTPLP
jgi:hypothetical protein